MLTHASFTRLSVAWDLVEAYKRRGLGRGTWQFLLSFQGDPLVRRDASRWPGNSIDVSFCRRTLDNRFFSLLVYFTQTGKRAILGDVFLFCACFSPRHTLVTKPACLILVIWRVLLKFCTSTYWTSIKWLYLFHVLPAEMKTNGGNSDPFVCI